MTQPPGRGHANSRVPTRTIPKQEPCPRGRTSQPSFLRQHHRRRVSPPNLPRKGPKLRVILHRHHRRLQRQCPRERQHALLHQALRFICAERRLQLRGCGISSTSKPSGKTTVTVSRHVRALITTGYARFGSENGSGSTGSRIDGRNTISRFCIICAYPGAVNSRSIV
jgi:hypothetical protein